MEFEFIKFKRDELEQEIGRVRTVVDSQIAKHDAPVDFGAYDKQQAALKREDFEALEKETATLFLWARFGAIVEAEIAFEKEEFARAIESLLQAKDGVSPEGLR